MSKNLTRKGLALGAVVALGATLFAGSPAFAANEINVAPSAGTSYNTVFGSVYNLSTTFAPGFTPSSYAQLKYQIKTDANSTVSYGLSSSAAVASPATSVAVSTTVVTGATSSASATTVNYLGLTATASTAATTSVEVTAFVDANNNDALNAGEWSTVKTVTFKKAADITPVVTVLAPSTGDTTLKATVAWGDLNVEQIADETVKFTATTDLTTASAGISTDTTDTAWSKVLPSSNTLDAADVVTAQAYVGATALGTAASAVTSARTIATIAASLTEGANAVSTSARLNSAYAAQAVVKAAAVGSAAALPVSGAAVTAAVTVSGSLSTTRTLSINGTVYNGSVALPTAVALTSNAAGLVSVAIVPTGFAAGETVTVTFTSQNLTSAVTATQVAAAYTVTDDGASTVVATNKNTAVTLGYSVKDQFGVASARTNERLVVSATNAAVLTQYVAVSAGKVSFSVAQTTDSAADVVVTSQLQISTNTNGTITWTTDGTDTVTNTIKTRSAAYAFTVAPAIDATNGINNGAWTAAGAQKQTITSYDQTDSTLTTGLVSPAASTVWAKVTLTGSNAGEKLTVSGTDVFLSIDGAAATKNTASKVAQAAAAVIYVASTKAGAKTLTVTNGSVSAPVVVTFDAATVASRAAVALGDLVSVSQAGRSVDVSAVVTDKFGNVVSGATVTLSATGVGYLANTTATSDANGKVAGKLVVGALEAGDAVVTASVTLGDSTVVTASKTVSFGATDAQVDIVGKRVTAVASFSKGKTVAFYVDGVKKWSKTSASDADVVLNYNLKKGTHTITVKISGGFVTTEKFIVK